MIYQLNNRKNKMKKTISALLICVDNIPDFMGTRQLY